MEFLDYYKILEVPKSASQGDIKIAYRKLARKYHPDLNPNNSDAELKFKEINEANEVLSNTEKRKKFDKHGKDWKHADDLDKATKEQGHQRERQEQSAGNFSDYFESMFGSTSGNRERQSKFRGQDLNAELHLKLKDVFKTQQQTITVNSKHIRMTFPAGIENGQTIKVANHGMAGVNGGPNGDLYITFSIADDNKFKRVASNLYLSVELDIYTALLGGEINVDTFDGKVKLKVSPGTQSGTKVKLKGKGFPVYKKENEFGALYITYNIILPVNLSEREKELLLELKQIREQWTETV